MEACPYPAYDFTPPVTWTSDWPRLRNARCVALDPHRLNHGGCLLGSAAFGIRSRSGGFSRFLRPGSALGRMVSRSAGHRARRVERHGLGPPAPSLGPACRETMQRIDVLRDGLFAGGLVVGAQARWMGLGMDGFRNRVPVGDCRQCRPLGRRVSRQTLRGGLSPARLFFDGSFCDRRSRIPLLFDRTPCPP